MTDPGLAGRLGVGRTSWACREHWLLAAVLDVLGVVAVVLGIVVDISLFFLASVTFMIAACMHLTYRSRRRLRQSSHDELVGCGHLTAER